MKTCLTALRESNNSYCVIVLPCIVGIRTSILRVLEKGSKAFYLQIRIQTADHIAFIHVWITIDKAQFIIKNASPIISLKKQLNLKTSKFLN